MEKAATGVVLKKDLLTLKLLFIDFRFLNILQHFNKFIFLIYFFAYIRPIIHIFLFIFVFCFLFFISYIIFNCFYLPHIRKHLQVVHYFFNYFIFTPLLKRAYCLFHFPRIEHFDTIFRTRSLLQLPLLSLLPMLHVLPTPDKKRLKWFCRQQISLHDKRNVKEKGSRGSKGGMWWNLILLSLFSHTECELCHAIESIFINIKRLDRRIYRNKRLWLRNLGCGEGIWREEFSATVKTFTALRFHAQ